MNTFTEYNFLCHHGVLGMKWGIRRYQNYDGTLIKSGSITRRKTKYTNIDGSLNERGKIHSQAYINKELAKNEKYYNKHIKKYEKLAEKYKDDPEMKKKFEAMKEDAIRTKKSVDKSIKSMGIDEIMANEQEAKIKALKIAGAVAAGASVVAGSGLTVSAISEAIKNSSDGVKAAIKNFNPRAPMDTVIEIVNTTPIGQKAEQAVETAIRTYADARAFATAIYLEQAFTRLKQAGVTDRVAELGSETINKTISGIHQEGINTLSNTLKIGVQNVASADVTPLATAINNTIANAVSDVNSVNIDTSKVYNVTDVYNGRNNADIAILMNDPEYAKLINQVLKQ